MSLRPELYATDVSPLMELARTGDTTLVPQIVEWYRTNMASADASTLQMVETFATQLIQRQLPGDAESEDHVLITGTLAKLLEVQTLEKQVADGDWKHQAWTDYFAVVRGYLPQESQPLADCLVKGVRPIFGKRIDTTWSYYGYLLADEVARLSADLTAAAEAHPEIDTDGFIGGFHEELQYWLESCVKQQTGLWLFAN